MNENYYYIMDETIIRTRENEYRDVHAGGYETLEVMLTEALNSRDAVEHLAKTEVRSSKRNNVYGFQFTIYQYFDEEAIYDDEYEELEVNYLADDDGCLVLYSNNLYISDGFDLEGITQPELLERL